MILGPVPKDQMLIFHFLKVISDMLCFLMIFSLIFRGHDIFSKQKHIYIYIYTFYIDSGRSTCCYFVCFRYDYGNTRFSSDAFPINSFKDFNRKIMCIGGPQALKTVEIPRSKVIIVVLYVFVNR